MSVLHVSFGMIVLNGWPFVRYNLRALYPFAHQIVVAEGAVPGAASIASPEGHSTDGTLAELRRFAVEEDPDGKVIVLTAEDLGHADGFWCGEKLEQSRAVAQRATGDVLWFMDVDEFLLPADITRVIALLQESPAITAVTFPGLNFWGALDYCVDGWYLRRKGAFHHRVFRWGPGYRYVDHRPPRVLDPQGRDLRTLGWLDAAQVRARGIVLYHYSLLFPRLVREKVAYYKAAEPFGSWFAGADEWLRDSYETLAKPYRVHNVYRYPSWLERSRVAHPPHVEAMMADIEAGRITEELRLVEDIEELLSRRSYATGRAVLKAADRPARALGPAYHAARRHGGKLKRWLGRRSPATKDGEH